MYESGTSLELFYNYTSYLCQRFHPEYYHHELVIQIRKIVTVLFYSLIISNVSLQMFLTYLILFISGLIHLWREPYRTIELNQTEGVLIALLQLECLGGLLLEATKPRVSISLASDLNSSYLKFQGFQYFISYGIFGVVLIAGCLLSARVFILNMQRSDGGRGKESSLNITDRSMGIKYQFYLRCWYTLSFFLIFIVYIICAVFDNKSPVEIVPCVLLWLLIMAISFYIFFISKDSKITRADVKKADAEGPKKLSRAELAREKKRLQEVADLNRDKEKEKARKEKEAKMKQQKTVKDKFDLETTAGGEMTMGGETTMNGERTTAVNIISSVTPPDVSTTTNMSVPDIKVEK